jgi:anti-sigma B factor antagonist
MIVQRARTPAGFNFSHHLGAATMASIVSQRRGEVLIVYFNDARILDATEIDQVKREVVALIEKAKDGKMLLNFQEVRFMSSSMLGALVTVSKKCKAAEVQLKISNIAADLMQVFTMTRLDKLFEFHDDESGAIAAFEKKRGFWGRG